MAIPINEFLAKFQGVKKTGNHWMAKCPTHADDKASLSLKIGRNGGIVLFCHAKCETKDILEAVGSTLADIMPETTNGHQTSGKPKPQIIAEYNYCDEQGKLVYQAVRYEPKDFRQRRPDGVGGWIWSLGDTPRVLYRLTELIAADPDQWVFVCEGEKDVDMLRAWGLVATSNVAGAGKWRKEYNKYFKGRKVCIIPDNDPPPSIDEVTGKPKEGFQGQKHAIQVYDAIRDVAAVVRILALPGLPVKGDVTDWKQAGGTKEELLALADSVGKIPALEFTKRVTAYAKIIALNKGEDPAVAFTARLIQGTITIDYGMIKKLSIQTELAWEAIVAANDPPRYFKKGSTPVRLNLQNDEIELQELTPERMRCELDLVADWREKGMDGKPPKETVTNVLAWEKQPLPLLDRIVRVPVFGPSGRLQILPGYHSDARTYYSPFSHLKCLTVPAKPTDEEVEGAVKLIRELIHDFPFESDCDRAHAIALFLLPFCRDMIDGPTPLHLIEASKERTGKSLLLEMLLYVSVGDDTFDLAEAGKNQDEWEKKITTALLSGLSVVVIDNINNRLDSGHLAKALTRPVWDGRLLGKNASARVPIKCIWAATSNNIKMSGEMTGRTVRSRIVSNLEHPELRTKFLHPDLKEWVIREHERLIQAAHILVQNWIAKGKPVPGPATNRLGKFENWSIVIGGILESAGIPGFLANYVEASEELNDEAGTWRTFCEKWYSDFGSDKKVVTELLPIAEGINDFYLSGDDANARARSLSRQLRDKKKQVYDVRDEDGVVTHRLQIRDDVPLRKGGTKQWYLKFISDEEPEDEQRIATEPDQSDLLF